jgi:hypothetical protein
MKIPLVISAVCMVVLALLIAGCTSPPPGGVVPSITPTGETPVAETTPAPTLSPVCEFTSCHGPDLACGPNPPQACTAIYQLGDKCRQYAFCSKANDTCQLVTTPQFDACRSCIGKCGGADPAEILSCEEKC